MILPHIRLRDIIPTAFSLLSSNLCKVLPTLPSSRVSYKTEEKKVYLDMYKLKKMNEFTNNKFYYVALEKDLLLLIQYFSLYEILC